MFAFLLAAAIALAPNPAPGGRLTEEQKIVHTLNRLGFGPRPGDVDRVKKMGLKQYVEQQLHPESLKDEAVRAKTGGFGALKMSGMEIAEMERAVQMSNGQLQRLRRALAERGAMEGSNAIQNAIANAQTGTNPTPQQHARRGLEIYRNATPEERKMLDDGRMARQRVNETGAQLVMNKLIRAAESEKQLYEVLVDFWSNHFNIDSTKVRAAKVVDEEKVIRPFAMGKFRDLLNASATSAAMMLYLDNAQSTAPGQAPPRGRGRAANLTLERLKEGAQRGLQPAIRMLNRVQERAKTENISEDEAFQRMRAQLQAPAAPARRGGLNENYARELMELHTLGVDGGYTQNDVTEVARCLTGWGVRGGRYSGEFEFHPFLHDRGEKVVLGKVIPAGGGMEDGKMVLDMLASHPSTMRHISAKLCRRFVSDDPPKSLVDRCVETWKRTDGDIREIVRTIITSKEFYAPTAFHAKIKSPFEYAISSVRALGATVEPQAPSGPAGFRPAAAGFNVFAPNGSGQTNPRLLAGQIGTLGQPLFNYGFPTGYPEESTKWVSSGALIARINFALGLVNGRIADVALGGGVLQDTAMAGKPLPQRIDTLSRELLGIAASAGTRATLIKQLGGGGTADSSAARIGDDTPGDTRRIAALLLGSPEFQRR